ncbi:MAG: LacI family DNA-binding transcriptional regulator [Clostridia bacterium]|nr:LacI family DNA-binding transcriptional regulator [Clostridia bacterium]
MGKEKVTIYTIAEELNMTPSMVSRAFKPDGKVNEKKRQLILETAERMGFEQNRMASRLSMKPIRIATLIYGRFPGYYDEMVRGVEAASRDLSDYKVTNRLFVMPFGEYSQEDAYRVLDEVEADKYDGLVLHGLYGEDVAQRIDRLTDAGVVVCTLHNDILSCRRLFTSMSDTELTGSMAAQLLSIFLPPNRNRMVLFSGSMKSMVHQTLSFSFIRHAEERGMTLLRHYATEDYPERAAEQVRDAFETYSGIDGIYISSANSAPILRYLEENRLGDRVAVVASDVFQELSAYMRKGIVNATIYQDPYRQGKRAFEGLFYYIADGIKPNSYLMTPPQIVMTSNLSVYERWKNDD